MSLLQVAQDEIRTAEEEIGEGDGAPDRTTKGTGCEYDGGDEDGFQSIEGDGTGPGTDRLGGGEQRDGEPPCHRVRTTRVADHTGHPGSPGDAEGGTARLHGYDPDSEKVNTGADLPPAGWLREIPAKGTNTNNMVGMEAVYDKEAFIKWVRNLKRQAPEPRVSHQETLQLARDKMGGLRQIEQIQLGPPQSGLASGGGHDESSDASSGLWTWRQCCTRSLGSAGRRTTGSDCSRHNQKEFLARDDITTRVERLEAHGRAEVETAATPVRPG